MGRTFGWSRRICGSYTGRVEPNDGIGMTVADQVLRNWVSGFLNRSTKPMVGAAASKLFAASVGEIVMVLSARRATCIIFADIEWMFSRTAGQFYVVEAADKEQAFVLRSRRNTKQ